MIQTFQTNIKNVEEKIYAIGEGLLRANELILEALKECESDKFSQAKSHIKNISSITD